MPQSFKETTMSDRDAFTLRLKPDVLRFVKQAADEENRSIPNFVETVLIAEKRRREALALPKSETGACKVVGCWRDRVGSAPVERE